MVEVSPFSTRLQRLVSLLMRIGMQNHYQFVRKQGLSVPQMMILYHIHRRGGATVSDIGEEFRISSAAASQILDRLVQQGYLIRREHPQDRRIKEHSITETGKKLVEASWKTHQNWVIELASQMDQDTQTRLLPLLDELVLNLQKWLSSKSLDAE